MNKVRLPAWNGPVLKAAIWLRRHMNIPHYQSIDREFAEYFGCRMIKDCDGDYRRPTIYAEFDEAGATLFALRWS